MHSTLVPARTGRTVARDGWARTVLSEGTPTMTPRPVCVVHSKSMCRRLDGAVAPRHSQRSLRWTAAGALNFFRHHRHPLVLWEHAVQYHTQPQLHITSLLLRHQVGFWQEPSCSRSSSTQGVSSHLNTTSFLQYGQ